MNEHLGNESISLIFDLSTAILVKWSKAGEWIAERKYCIQKGADVYTEEVGRSVFELFLIVRGSLRNDCTTIEFKKLESDINSREAEKIEEAFNKIDQWLYKKGVTKFDTKKAYERNRAELSNIAKGL